ncbi:MAG: hypothetical protein NZM09_10685 [Ignavibacterium sp.]|nr:hypothetical protein [Ignavibacterium sp.]MDW8376143.1 hypothetical protein [Ignavibacteriales bacterium]
MIKKIEKFVGVDVQTVRGCCYYVIDNYKKYVDSGWVKENIPETLRKILLKISNNSFEKIAIGIDAPRMPLKKFRKRNFSKEKNQWELTKDKKLGRECEVIIKSFNIGNPQWTQTFKNSPDWMRLGYSIFEELNDFPYLYEVFPSASYKMLENDELKFELCLKNFSNGIKDMLDASVAAITVYEFINGRGCEVGGEDNLGTIILPREIS